MRSKKKVLSIKAQAQRAAIWITLSLSADMECWSCREQRINQRVTMYQLTHALGMYEFVKKGDAPVVGITKLDGITMEDLKRPRRAVPLPIPGAAAAAAVASAPAPAL